MATTGGQPPAPCQSYQLIGFWGKQGRMVAVFSSTGERVEGRGFESRAATFSYGLGEPGRLDWQHER